MRKTTTQKPPTDVFIPNDRYPLASRVRATPPSPPTPPARSDGESREPRLIEVGVDEIRVGDTVRVRLYQGMPGRWFSAPSRELRPDVYDLEIARLEPALMPSNGYYRVYPLMIAMSACGRCFALDQSDYYVHERPVGGFGVTAEVARRALPMLAMRALPNPDARAHFGDVIDGEYEEPLTAAEFLRCRLEDAEWVIARVQSLVSKLPNSGLIEVREVRLVLAGDK